jgi:tetratricopeptide (TPR) repeat protein
MRTRSVAVAVLILVLAPLNGVRQEALRAQEPPHEHGGHVHGLGTVDFPNSGAPAAQEPFLRGIALLHSFEYEDAADAFREAQTADPSFALAYWGEALTSAKLLWGRDDPEAARGALARLAPNAAARLALARTERERAFGAAVEALYAEADLPTRARGYADSMRTLAERDTDDLEAAAFASIAQLMATYAGALDVAQRATAREAAIAFADRVFRVNRDHPGAAHYLIHAYDDPAVAERGLEVARAYAEIAPDAQHALHMPSHIFVQVGLWDDVVASNERAWAASRTWTARRSAGPTSLDFHSLEWLQHGYLQQGRYQAARALVDTARAVLAGADLTGSVDPYYAEARLAFRHSAETRDWRSPPVVVADPGSAQAAESRYAFFSLTTKYQAAVGAIVHGDTTAASIEAFRQEVAARLAGRAPGGHLSVMPLHVDALLARAHGDTKTAVALLRLASELEDAVAPVGPPNILPTLEWLGGLLLETGMADEAAAAYERALARWPNRSASLLGLARARRALGDKAGAAERYRQLLANWHSADADLPELAEARNFLTSLPAKTPTAAEPARGDGSTGGSG